MKGKFFNHLFLSGLFVVAGGVSVGPARAATLNVPLFSQDHDLWCWDASSQMVLGYYNITVSQDEIAAYGTNGVDTTNLLYGSSAATKTDPAKHGVDFILDHFGNISSTAFARSLNPDELDTEITSGRPVLARIGWLDTHGNAAGGHLSVIVGYDKDSNLVDLNDPWPDNGALVMDYNTLNNGAPGTYSGGAAAHQWTHSLTVAAAIDLVFLIDSTGSMHDDIGNAKANAISILNQLLAKFPDCRVAVVDFKDKPAPDGPGDNSDYVDKVQTAFTRDKSVALDAINSLIAIGGGDLPEGMYSALYDCLDGNIIGGWRPNPTKRMIVLMGDAGGHDPVEPWAGGKSAADVIAKANTVNANINIQSLVIGNETLATADFQSVSGGTGGSFFSADTSVDLSPVISQIIEGLNPRAPTGNVSSFTPKFSFDETNVGMAKPVSKVFVQLDKFDPKSNSWKLYKKQPVAGFVGAYTWTPTTPLPQGDYRWRLNFQQPATNIIGPAGQVISKERSQVTAEDSYLTFTRLPVLPSDPVLVSPAASFSPTTTTVTLSWSKATAASKYTVFIKKGDKAWKTITVTPPAKNLDAPVLTLKVPGFAKNSAYSWRVESLNFDKPKPTE